MLSSAIPRHRGGRIHRLRRCHNPARQASTGVGTFTLTGQITFTLNIKAEAQKRMHSEDHGTLPSEREGAQHYCSTDLPVYGIGRSFETFGWVPPMTKGWGETRGCATLWGCSMVHKGKNIVNGSKKIPNLSLQCARRARTVRVVPALCTRCAQTPS